MRVLISVDKRKMLALFEEAGERRVVSVTLDKNGNPIIDAALNTELDRLFASTRFQLPNTPFVRQIPITRLSAITTRIR